MMPALTQKQIEEIYQKLPEEIKIALFSEINALFVRQAAAKFHLQPEKIPDLASEIGDVMMGITSLSKFKTALQENLNLDGQTAQALSQEIDFKIFPPIRISLIKIHGLAAPEEKNAERPTPFPITAPRTTAAPIPAPIPGPVSPAPAFVPPSKTAESRPAPMPGRPPIPAAAPNGLPSRPVSPFPSAIPPGPIIPPTRPVTPLAGAPHPFIPPRPLSTPPGIIVPKTITPSTSAYQRPAYESPALSPKPITPSFVQPSGTAEGKPLSPPAAPPKPITPPPSPAESRPITPPQTTGPTIAAKPGTAIPAEPIDLTKINIGDLKGNVVDLKNLE